MFKQSALLTQRNVGKKRQKLHWQICPSAKCPNFYGGQQLAWEDEGKARNHPVTVAGLRERGGLRCCGLGLLGSLGRRRPTWATNQRGGRVFAGLGLITGLFFATGLCIPRGIAAGGLIGIGLGLPRRRLGACGFNYHMLSYGPAGIHSTGGTKGPAHRRHKLRRRK